MTDEKTSKPLWELEIQGERLSLRCHRRHRYKEPKNGRGIIVAFSKPARKRMLERLAEIDWQKAGDGDFVTYTYPDNSALNTMEERTVQRSVIHRYVEKVFGSKVPAVWKVEWKRRLSGRHRGKAVPHIHVVYFGHRGLDVMPLTEHWMQTIGADEWTQVKVVPLDACKMASIYAAKYCAKMDDSLLLDSVPYLNRTGRHSGWYRKKLIPWCDKRSVEKVSSDVVEMLRRRAGELLSWYDEKIDGGFTLLGRNASEVLEELREMGIDDSRE